MWFIKPRSNSSVFLTAGAAADALSEGLVENSENKKKVNKFSQPLIEPDLCHILNRKRCFVMNISNFDV